MNLNEGLSKFLQECEREPVYMTVECSFDRAVTDDELSFMNSRLKPLGYRIYALECAVCRENSGGTHPYHLERDSL